MNKEIAIAECTWLGLIGCQNNGPDDRLSSLPSDEEIMTIAYDLRYQVLNGFLVDERASTTRSYTVYHVKDPSLSFELCADVFETAHAWELADNESRLVSGEYVGSYENDRYFEIVRELEYTEGIGNIGDVTSPGFSRLFKCSYVNRDGVDRNLRDGYAGHLNVEPRSPEDIKTFVEYMWQFAFFWPARKKVLESFSIETENAYQNTLLLAFITNQGASKCDLIELVDWVFTVDKGDGQMTKEFSLLYQLEAHLVNGLESPRVYRRLHFLRGRSYCLSRGFSRILNSSRARYRFRHRRISRSVLPSARRLRKYA